MKKMNVIGNNGRARAKNFIIMLTEKEREEINNKAYSAGMPASTWARTELLKMCREGK